jgi:hypothetical protein
MIPLLLTLAMIPDSTLFDETFDEGTLPLDTVWKLEGTGKAWIGDGRLQIREDSNGVGVVLWLREIWPADVALSFDVSFSNNRGIGVFFIATTGPTEGRTGEYEEYIRGELDSYSFSFHRYFPDGRNNPGANARRNSGFHLLSQADPDPMLEAERTYRLEITKQGARLLAKVDGRVVHDVVDHGEFGAPLGEGRIGFRLRGDHSCVMSIDNVHIAAVDG